MTPLGLDEGRAQVAVALPEFFGTVPDRRTCGPRGLDATWKVSSFGRSTGSAGAAPRRSRRRRGESAFGARLFLRRRVQQATRTLKYASSSSG